MAQAEAEQPEEELLQKEVTLVAYADEEHKRSKDEFVTGVTGVDTSEREATSSRDVEITIDLGQNYPTRARVYEHDFTEEGLEAFKRSLANSKMKEYIEVEDERKTSSRRITSISSALDKWMGQVRDELPEEIGGLTKVASHSGTVLFQDDQDVTRIRIKRPKVDEMRVLAKESERESDDLYETMSERWSAKFQIIIEGDNEEELDRRTEAVIPVLHKWLPKQTGIGKVRYMACTVTQKKKGECYNI